MTRETSSLLITGMPFIEFKGGVSCFDLGHTLASPVCSPFTFLESVSGHGIELPVAALACQVILPDIGLFREFEPRRVHSRKIPLGLFLVHKLTCRKRESLS